MWQLLKHDPETQSEQTIGNHKTSRLWKTQHRRNPVTPSAIKQGLPALNLWVPKFWWGQMKLDCALVMDPQISVGVTQSSTSHLWPRLRWVRRLSPECRWETRDPAILNTWQRDHRKTHTSLGFFRSWDEIWWQHSIMSVTIPDAPVAWYFLLLRNRANPFPHASTPKESNRLEIV